MRLMRSLTDRMIGLFAPEAKASALYYYQYRCVPGCGRYKTERRQCHDGSGYCTAWGIIYCDC